MSSRTIILWAHMSNVDDVLCRCMRIVRVNSVPVGWLVGWLVGQSVKWLVAPALHLGALVLRQNI